MTPQWKRHQSELVTLAERPSTALPSGRDGDGENPGAANNDPDGINPADRTNGESPAAAPLDMAPQKRLSSTISSSSAARRMEAYLESNPMKRTAFAVQAQTTDRTLRSFRKTGKVRRDIFENITKAMGVTPEALLELD
jgi:hypothetical protein